MTKLTVMLNDVSQQKISCAWFLCLAFFDQRLVLLLRTKRQII